MAPALKSMAPALKGMAPALRGMAPAFKGMAAAFLDPPESMNYPRRPTNALRQVLHEVGVERVSQAAHRRHENHRALRGGQLAHAVNDRAAVGHGQSQIEDQHRVVALLEPLQRSAAIRDDVGKNVSIEQALAQ